MVKGKLSDHFISSWVRMIRTFSGKPLLRRRCARLMLLGRPVHLIIKRCSDVELKSRKAAKRALELLKLAMLLGNRSS